MFSKAHGCCEEFCGILIGSECLSKVPETSEAFFDDLVCLEKPETFSWVLSRYDLFWDVFLTFLRRSDAF